MNILDYVVLLGTLLGIAAYGIWRTRGRRDLPGYLKGGSGTRWLTIGLSVMATQASAITFLSTPGQGYRDGLGFIQNYLPQPIALILVAALFAPIYRRLNVYTAYEYLGRRFDTKTRLLGAGLFLIQRGLGAGITIYAPAIVLSTVLGWRLDVTIVASGLVAIAYTVSGGNEAVSITQKYQFAVILLGMAAAGAMLWHRLPPALTAGDALAVAGGFGKLHAIDFSLDPHRRYTIWSGMIGGFFLALSYFGTDQSQVGRYLAGASLRESRMGLMFNAVCKVPMQFLILLLGTLLFVFYRFEPPPVYFNESAWTRQVATADSNGHLAGLETRFAEAFSAERHDLDAWLQARHAGDRMGAEAAQLSATVADQKTEAIWTEARTALAAADPRTGSNDADYIFIHFIVHQLPHGAVGLLVAAFFAAALSSKAGELNALASTSTVDIYRPHLRPQASDAHYVGVSRVLTAFWGCVAVGFALYIHSSENLIQAVNIIGSLFYGVVLGLFLVAFGLRRVGGTAVFWAAVGAQALVLVLHFCHTVSYLWYNVVGCVACVGLSAAIQPLLPRGAGPPREAALPV